MGEFGGPNLYAYVGSNPINIVDPTGRFGVLGAIYGAISGAVGGAITGYASTGTWEGALGGAAVGGVVGAVVGIVAPEFSNVAAQVATDAIIGGISSYGGQVAGNAVGNWANGNSLTQGILTNNISAGAVVGSAFGGGLGVLGTEGIAVGSEAVDFGGVLAATGKGVIGGGYEAAGDWIQHWNKENGSGRCQ